MTKTNYTAVGAFVILLSLTLFFIAFWLSFGLEKKTYHRYTAYMTESVSGLSVNSPVKYNGVNVGFVEHIRLRKDDPSQVELHLEIDENVSVTETTSAMLATQGLTGISYIDLRGGSSNAPILKAHAGEAYPVIKTEPSVYKRLDVTLEQMATAMTGVANQMDTLINNNQETITETFKNMAEASKQFPALSKNLNQTLPLALDTFHSLDMLTVQLQTLTENIQENPSMLIRGRPAQPLGPGETR